MKSAPENATAQTIPLLSTIVPHMLKPRPPFPPAFDGAFNAALSAAKLATNRSFRPPPPSPARAGPANKPKTDGETTETTYFRVSIVSSIVAVE